MPKHSSKFVLDRHPWKEPLTVISKFSKQLSISLVTPIIGEKVRLDDENQVFKSWWEDLD